MGDDVLRTFIMNNADSDLIYLMEDAQLSLALQHKIVTVGFKTLRQFAGMEETRAAVRLLATSVFEVAAEARNMLAIAQLCSAWESSREFVSRETALRAEAKLQGQPRPLGIPERTAMKRMLEAKFGKTAKEDLPSSTYMAEKLEEVELNEPTASALDEIASAADKEEPTLGAALNNLGALMVTRKRSRLAMPVDPEQLRQRLKIECNVWLMLGCKFPNRPWLAGLEPKHFVTYVEHFLSKKVHNLEIGGTAVGPAWSITLAYEFECRRKAFELIREEGQTLVAALQAVVKDPEIKELHFTTSIALTSRTMSHAPPVPTPTGGESKGAKRRRLASERAAAATSPQPTKPKGKGKGKEKGKAKGDKQELAWKTPDGRDICFAYNSPSGCSGTCSRVHVCRVKGCGKDHTLMAHPAA